MAVIESVTRTLILLAIATGYCSSQNKSVAAQTAPRLTITLPEEIAPETVWLRYALVGPGGTGARIKTEPNVRQYAIDGFGHEVRVVAYSPGCEFRTYDVTPSDGPEVEERFDCKPLPTRIIHAHMWPDEIPRTIYFKNEKRLDIVGELEADWICNFFLTQQHQTNVIMAGSCLVLTVPLDNLGILDPANKGAFDIEIPDFGSDPAFNRNDGMRTDYIQMGLHDKKVGVSLGTITPNSSPAVRGLRVQASYPEEITFTTVR